MVSDTRQAGTLSDGPVRGRGAQLNPTNRFEKLSLHVLDEHLERVAVQEDPAGRQVPTEVFRDTTRTILNRVESPDLPFGWTLNPYRGCEHGCIYCYARPTHETLSLSSGLDFENKLFAKPEAAELLRKELGKASWQGEPIVMSGVTDPYQPVESKLGITRDCLQVMAESRQAVSIVTKSRLILRDIDLLQELAKHNAVHVAVSLTTLDNHLASKLEPRAAAPRDRLWTIQRLASAGIPVSVMTAPIIPSLNDRELPLLLKAASEAGAQSAGYVLLRLPHQIKQLFDDWLARHFPHRRARVKSLMTQARGGKLYDATWHQRMRGQGPYAEQIRQTFNLFATRHNLRHSLPPLNRSAFRRPQDTAQMSLFESN